MLTIYSEVGSVGLTVLVVIVKDQKYFRLIGLRFQCGLYLDMRKASKEKLSTEIETVQF